MQYIIILCTAGSKENALKISNTLVKDKLAACVNIVPKITSVYCWKDEIVCDEEFLLIIKTKSQNYKIIESRILELHSYETPEIISIDIKEGSKNYLNWIKEQSTTQI